MKLLLEDDEVDGIKILDDTNDQKQNLSYLEEVSEFMKLNYRCKDGTVEKGSFSCGKTIDSESGQKQNMILPGFTTTKDLDLQLESILKSIEPDVMKAVEKIMPKGV